jgi:hypothetical protein
MSRGEDAGDQLGLTGRAQTEVQLDEAAIGRDLHRIMVDGLVASGG